MNDDARYGRITDLIHEIEDLTDDDRIHEKLLFLWLFATNFPRPKRPVETQIPTETNPPKPAKLERVLRKKHQREIRLPLMQINAVLRDIAELDLEIGIGIASKGNQHRLCLEITHPQYIERSLARIEASFPPIL